jgi:hypothetical protein
LASAFLAEKCGQSIKTKGRALLQFTLDMRGTQDTIETGKNKWETIDSFTISLLSERAWRLTCIRTIEVTVVWLHLFFISRWGDIQLGAKLF